MLIAEEDCPFCIDPEHPEKIAPFWNELAYVRYDAYPVTNMHVLIIPFRHIWSFELASKEEMEAVDQLMLLMMNKIRDQDPQVVAFNAGWNGGPEAGQTVMHAHMHLIPRRKGDVKNPRGGIRNVIPGKGDY